MKRPTQRDNAETFMLGLPEGKPIPAWVAKALQRKATTKRCHPEDDLQAELCRYLALCPGLLFFSVPNHLYTGNGDWGKRAWYMEKQKRMGLTPGASDLVIVFRNKDGATTLCFAELKAGNNTATTAQNDFMDKANGLGAHTSVVYSLKELREFLEGAGACNLPKLI